jgi:general secretion pathway protein J
MQCRAPRCERRVLPIIPRSIARRFPCDSGFTLLEILVVLVVLSLLVVTLTRGTQFGFQAWRMQVRTLAGNGDSDPIERTLRTLIERMDPGGVTGLPPRFEGTEHSVTFTTILPLTAGGDVTREADVTVALDDAHRLQLLWLPHFPNWFGPALTPRRSVLLDGVERLDFAYWRANQSGTDGSWTTAWNERDLPGLLRIRIVFPPHSLRHYPDLIAAPRRDRWQP